MSISINNTERYIFLDESGNLGTEGRYFVIACIDTFEAKSLHNIMKRKIGNAKALFPVLGTDHAHEIKASKAFPCVKYHILECIASKNVNISYIVLDKNHADPRLLLDKNIMYNYLTKLLLHKVITRMDRGTVINMIFDNHTTKITSYNSLFDYLKTHFNYECRYDLDLRMEYRDSDSSNAYVIQAADYVANAIYNQYEYDNNLFSDILSPKIIHTDKFPAGSFGT